MAVWESIGETIGLKSVIFFAKYQKKKKTYIYIYWFTIGYNYGVLKMYVNVNLNFQFSPQTKYHLTRIGISNLGFSSSL